MIDRRTLFAMCAAAGGAALLGPALPAAGEVEIGDNGLYIQDWFLDSFLNLPDDHAEATENGKHLAVLFEQRGCPYCRELHKVNLADPDIKTYMQKHFDVIQLDLWGSRAVTGFDGVEMEERALARKWSVNFTPTMVFFPRKLTGANNKGGKAEAARMPGYLKPFHFISLLEFVNDGGYTSQSFQQYLQDKFQSLKQQGIKPKVW